MSSPLEHRGEEAEMLWSSVIRRDRHSDGTFVYAVKSTGVYCRPSCPSRRPRRINVRFFSSPTGASLAGFRPCRRCSPDDVPRRDQLVALVLRRLDSEDSNQTLEAMGELLGTDATYLQRVFKQTTGITPLQYAQAVKAERLSVLLRSGKSVIEAQYDAGFDSSNALYRRSHDLLGMTAGRYKNGGAGETIHYTFLNTDLGRVMVAATTRGVCALRFGEDIQTLAELEQEFPKAQHVEDPLAMAPVVAGVYDRLAGLSSARPLQVDIEATAFQRRVWQALRKIPIGETRSYGEIAQEIGSPTAARAVARACAHNPVALVIPCHRIVRASGALSGYRWGTERKKMLLTRENASTGRPSPVSAGQFEQMPEANISQVE